ncbi:hypothetical protein ACHMWU_12440 [Aeromicrobium sp. UC242_57]
MRLTLTGEIRLADALNHLYVLLPVLDGAKHYWVADDEVDKLMRAGEGWLASHPERELISRRYLAHQRNMATEALTRLAELDGVGRLSLRKIGPVLSSHCATMQCSTPSRRCARPASSTSAADLAR